MSEAYFEPGFDFSKLKVEELKPFLKKHSVTIPVGTKKDGLVKLATQIANNRASVPVVQTNISQGANANTEDTREESGITVAADGEDTTNAIAVGPNARNSPEAPGPRPSRSLNRDTTVPTGTGDDAEYEQALAKFLKTETNKSTDELDDLQVAAKQLADAKRKFVEQSGNGASEDELNEILTTINKLKVSSEPKTFDEEGYVIYKPNNRANVLTRVIWKDTKRAIINCGPKNRAIWRLVKVAETGSYEGFEEAADWDSDRLRYPDPSPERTTPAEAQQVIGVAFERPIVVGLSMDGVFEKKSSKSRKDAIKSLPGNTTKEVQNIVKHKNRRHVHIIMSYTRMGVRFMKHLPFTHWVKVAGLSDSGGLELVMGAANDNKDRWEAWLLKEDPSRYTQLQEAGLSFQYDEFQNDLDNASESDNLQDKRDNTPETRGSTPEQDKRDNTPETRGSTPETATSKSRGSENTETNSDKGQGSRDISVDLVEISSQGTMGSDEESKPTSAEIQQSVELSDQGTTNSDGKSKPTSG